MSRPGPPSSRGGASRDRPPPPVPSGEDGDEGPPPVPKPRAGPRVVAAGGRKRNLPVWPPPSSANASSSSTTASVTPALPSRGGGGSVADRGPAPLPPSSPPSSPMPPAPPRTRTPTAAEQTQPTPPPPRHGSLSPAGVSSPPIHQQPQSPRFAPRPRQISSENSTSGGGGGGGGYAFGSCLQEAHEAINKRHEEELHALESFRAHVFFRAKADREYAQELAKINSRANKSLTTISQTSPIIQVRIILSINYFYLTNAVFRPIYATVLHHMIYISNLGLVCVCLSLSLCSGLLFYLFW